MVDQSHEETDPELMSKREKGSKNIIQWLNDEGFEWEKEYDSFTFSNKRVLRASSLTSRRLITKINKELKNIKFDEVIQWNNKFIRDNKLDDKFQVNCRSKVKKIMRVLNWWVTVCKSCKEEVGTDYPLQHKFENYECDECLGKEM